jgi:hypothetical protein
LIVDQDSNPVSAIVYMTKRAAVQAIRARAVAAVALTTAVARGDSIVVTSCSSVIADGAITWSGRNVTVCGLHLVRHEIYSGQGYRNKGASIEMNFQLSNRCNR